MENDLKSDVLNIGSKGQHDLRKTIIRMLKDGKKGKEIAKDLGVSEGHVSNVKKLYEAGGAVALKPKKRGRPAGKNEILTPEQEKEIQKIIVDKTPEQLRFKECMWTRNNIRQLIKDSRRRHVCRTVCPAAVSAIHAVFCKQRQGDRHWEAG